MDICACEENKQAPLSLNALDACFATFTAKCTRYTAKADNDAVISQAFARCCLFAINKLLSRNSPIHIYAFTYVYICTTE